MAALARVQTRWVRRVYNRNVRRLTVLAACAPLLLLAGCKKDIQNDEAVRQGVMSYLSKRSDLLSMDVSVNSVAFHDDEATAQVHFQAKGNVSAAAGMTMQYVLERKGNQWVVKGRAGASMAHGSSGIGMSQHGGSPGALDGMPNLPGAAGGSAGLPPGHPAVPGSGSQK